MREQEIFLTEVWDSKCDQIVNFHFVDRFQLFTKSRKSHIVKSRHWISYYLRFKRGFTVTRIAKFFELHHTSITTSTNNLEQLTHRGEVNELLEIIK